MPLRAQYITDVGISVSTYPDNATRRVEALYQTARRGRIAQPLAMQIWNTLISTYQRALNKGLPANQRTYDHFVVDASFAIQAVLHAEGRGGFGIGQKIVNLFMKDLWGLGIIQMPTEMLLHAPLDRIVLSKIRKVPATWAAWTRVCAAGIGSQEVIDYLEIQREIRFFHGVCPIDFPSVIQMEQFMWHKI